VAGAPAEEAGPRGLAAAADEVAVRVAAGATRKDAVAAVAAERGLRRRAVYEAVVHGPAGSPDGER
jgi:16S rRNA (cytidine1402-2'-O)-methyltransferase